VAALQPTEGADGVSEGPVPGLLKAAQVSGQQRAPVAGGGPHGATGKVATDPPERTSMS
jgi:hypothetical protein